VALVSYPNRLTMLLNVGIFFFIFYIKSWFTNLRNFSHEKNSIV